jgi:hypothetical protein
MSDVRCPSCGDVFRVLDVALPEGAIAGCPWCKARCSIADLRIALPPLAELFDAEGAALSEMASNAVPMAMDSGETFPESVPPAGELQTATHWESGDGELEADDPRRSDFETPDEPFDLNFGIAQEPRPLQQVTAFEFADEASGGPRARGRRPGSPLRSLISIVLGGLLALPVAGILLALIGKPLDLGFWPFIGKQRPLPTAIRAGEAANLDAHPSSSTGFAKRNGRSLGEDLTPQVQPNGGPEEFSASDRPTAGTGKPQAQNPLLQEPAPPTTPPEPSSEPISAPPDELEMPLGSDTVETEQAKSRAAEIAAMPPESNLFHDDYQGLVMEPELEADAPLVATTQPNAEPQLEPPAETGEIVAVAKPVQPPVTPATPDSAVAAAPATMNEDAATDIPTPLSFPTETASDLPETSGSRAQVAPEPSETAKPEPVKDAAPRVAAEPTRSTATREDDATPPSVPSTTQPAPQAPAAVAAQTPDPLTLPSVLAVPSEPANRIEPANQQAIASPEAALRQQPRPLSQAMRTELANIETAIQTLVNHREAEGTTVLKRRWAELYLAMAKAGEIAAPEDQAELSKLIRRMSDSDLIGPLSMMAANWTRIKSRPNNGVLVVGPIEKKDGKSYIQWRGMVPLEIRGFDPTIGSATGSVLVLGRIIASDPDGTVVEATFAEAKAG